MFKQISTQATALGLAALVTLSTLGSLHNLATVEHAATLATSETPVQQVVVVGQRAAQS
jgi:hypothetical protein